MLNMNLQFFAHKKGVGSTKNGRDSESKRLGAKRADGPPSGPPLGTYFSRRNETWPSPPFPDFIIIFALSANIFPPFLFSCDIRIDPAIQSSLSIRYMQICDCLDSRYYSLLATGYTEACFLSLPFLSNLRTPSTKANKVSSPPLPTFTPG